MRGAQIGEHGRGLILYRERGMEAAPCYVVDLDDAGARVLAQTLNRIRGEDDPEKKARLIEEVLCQKRVSLTGRIKPPSLD